MKDKFNFGQWLYAQGEWWTLVLPLAKGTDCFLVIARGETVPAITYVVKQMESDKKHQKDLEENKTAKEIEKIIEESHYIEHDNGHY